MEISEDFPMIFRSTIDVSKCDLSAILSNLDWEEQCVPTTTTDQQQVPMVKSRGVVAAPMGISTVPNLSELFSDDWGAAFVEGVEEELAAGDDAYDQDGHDTDYFCRDLYVSLSNALKVLTESTSVKKIAVLHSSVRKGALVCRHLSKDRALFDLVVIGDGNDGEPVPPNVKLHCFPTLQAFMVSDHKADVLYAGWFLAAMGQYYYEDKGPNLLRYFARSTRYGSVVGFAPNADAWEARKPGATFSAKGVCAFTDGPDVIVSNGAGKPQSYSVNRHGFQLMVESLGHSCRFIPTAVTGLDTVTDSEGDTFRRNSVELFIMAGMARGADHYFTRLMVDPYRHYESACALTFKTPLDGHESAPFGFPIPKKHLMTFGNCYLTLEERHYFVPSQGESALLEIRGKRMYLCTAFGNTELTDEGGNDLILDGFSTDDRFMFRVNYKVSGDVCFIEYIDTFFSCYKQLPIDYFDRYTHFLMLRRCCNALVRIAVCRFTAKVDDLDMDRTYELHRMFGFPRVAVALVYDKMPERYDQDAVLDTLRQSTIEQNVLMYIEGTNIHLGAVPVNMTSLEELSRTKWYRTSIEAQTFLDKSTNELHFDYRKLLILYRTRFFDLQGPEDLIDVIWQFKCNKAKIGDVRYIPGFGGVNSLMRNRTIYDFIQRNFRYALPYNKVKYRAQNPDSRDGSGRGPGYNWIESLNVMPMQLKYLLRLSYPTEFGFTQRGFYYCKYIEGLLNRPGTRTFEDISNAIRGRETWEAIVQYLGDDSNVNALAGGSDAVFIPGVEWRDDIDLHQEVMSTYGDDGRFVDID